MNDLIVTMVSFVCMSESAIQIDRAKTTTHVQKCPVVVYMVQPEPSPPINYFAARRSIVKLKPRGVVPPEVPMDPKPWTIELPKPVPEPEQKSDSPVTKPVTKPAHKRVATIARPSDIAMRTSVKAKKQIPCKKGRSRNNPRHRCERY